VSLQDLIIDGLGTGGVGIQWIDGSALEIKNCIIRNFKGASFGFGIRLNKGSPSKLVVTDSIFANNGAGATGAGIRIHPAFETGSARVFLERVTAVNNVFGIAADGTFSTTGIPASGMLAQDAERGSHSPADGT
jgi:hypothetical protein